MCILLCSSLSGQVFVFVYSTGFTHSYSSSTLSEFNTNGRQKNPKGIECE